MIEFLLHKRPVSLQVKRRENLQAWKDFIYGRARQFWRGPPLTEDNDIHLTVVYFCNDSPVDVDNIIKPIQDALSSLVFADDVQITDVESHRRYLSDGIDVTNLPSMLAEAAATGEESVYIKVGLASALEEYL
ncbi:MULTISPECIES: RusA family crossover junction endodeoxyribonuclease [unclassified Endozoicomonas]|uniref:RusA family crossover junction endodeoxyribonuclease n=1 Tax=unclassified Endozoicomonas TaxID=2644528 RepID=UPI003BB70969